MYPFIRKVNLYTVDIIDFFVLIDFLYFSQNSIYINLRSQVYTVLGDEVRRISSAKFAHFLSFMSQMAEE